MYSSSNNIINIGNVNNLTNNPTNGNAQVPLVTEKKLGSLDMFEPEDIIESEKIVTTLRDDFQLYESRQDTIKRQAVLSKLKQLIKDFIYGVGMRKGVPEEDCKSGGNIYSFGSYRLGVHSPGADIDVLCVAPNYVDRNKDFFNSLITVFKSNSDISELCDVQDAYVPVIKMKYSGIQIDLLFANLHYKRIEENLDLQENNILKNCDKESILSLNGSRVTDQILKLVPNEENFNLTLKAIKLWADVRGLYSNAFGYFGGVAYAILVAKICQLFPNYKPNKLLCMFFKVYSEWDFAKNPIMLNEIIKDIGFKVDLEVFNPDTAKYTVAIVTPAFPAMNSTHNVSETTKRVLINEFNFSKKLTELINNDKKLPWKALFSKLNIFEKYNSFLQIDVLSSNENDFKKWFGFIESKLRILIRLLEDIYQVKIHPYPNDFNITDSKFPFARAFFFGLQFINPNTFSGKDDYKKEQYLKIFLREPVSKFCAKINDPKIRNNATMNLRIRDKLKTQINKEVLKKFGGCLITSNELATYLELESEFFKAVIE